LPKENARDAMDAIFLMPAKVSLAEFVYWMYSNWHYKNKSGNASCL
jgi:hypothetical protein